mgnify:FL=1
MYIKFLAHGKGDPAKAASYLIDEVDHLNRPRADVQVLRGDPHTFTAIAESIENDWKYTSGVIAWSKDDVPTNEEIDQVLEAFEKHAFAGLQPHQYHFTAVLHEEDDGSKHVHFLVPRVELETGKALNIAPPNHQKYYDPLRDHFNYKNGWDRPDGIALQRDTQQPNHEHFIDKAAIRAGLKDRPVKDVRELVGDFLEQRIEHGFIRNRSDVVDALKELGEVTRQGKDYISLKIDEESKAIRLKGAFYEQEFSIKSYIEDRARTANDAGTSREFRAVSADHQKRAEQCREEFTRLATKRSEYNAERYQRPERDNTGLELNQEREQHNSQSYQRGGQDSTNSVKPTEAEFTAFDGGLRGLERQEQRSRQDDQNQKKSSDNQYHFVSTSSDFFHQQHLFWLRQQEQIRRHKRDANKGGLVEITGGEHEYSEMRNREKMEVVRTDRPEGRRVQQQYADIAGNKLNDARNRIIENHRAAADAAGKSIAAVTGAADSLASATESYQRTGALQQNFKRAMQRAANGTANDERATAFNKGNSAVRERLGGSITAAFDTVNKRIKHTAADQNDYAKHGTERDRETTYTIDRNGDQQNGFSRAISRKTTGFSPSPILKAISKLETQQEIEQARSPRMGW